MKKNDGLDNARKKIITIAYKTKEGHIASAFSILNILNVMYGKILRKGEGPEDPQRDIFIMSKGHASIGLYVVLAKYGLIQEKELDKFGEWGSILGGHPDRNKIPWVEASTGSLGHGFPMAVGFALGYKIQSMDNKVYTLVGDGELNEGSMWESMLLAGEHQLNNLCCIVDYNHSTDRAVDLSDLKKKYEAFGWDVYEVDGHNEKDLENAILNVSERPRAVIATTIKGYGCDCMENNPEWHHKSPNESEYVKLMEELS